MLFRSLRRLIRPTTSFCQHGRATGRKKPANFRPCVEALEDRWLPSTVSWINTAGGDWATASNWSTNKLPGILDDVVINVPGNVTITHSSGTDLIHSLTSSDTLVVSGGYLYIADASTLSGALTLSGGTLTGPNSLTVNGAFSWTGGTMGGSGSTHADDGFTISGGNGKTLDTRTLDYTGTATWSGTGGISLVNNATWNNLANSTLSVTGDASLSGSVGTFKNAGTLQKSAGTGTTTISAPLVNTGTVDATSGTLSITGNDTATGAFTVETGAALSFNGGTQGLQANSSISGAGDVTFNGANLTMLGSYTATGNTTVSNGTVSFDANATLSSLTLSGGTLGGTGTMTISGLLTWTGGTMAGGGHTVANGGITISSNNNKDLSNRILDNSGTATWTGGTLFMNSNSVWNNLVGSTLDAQNDAQFGGGNGSQYTGSIFNNAGTFTKSAGTGTTTVVSFVVNTGTIDAASGTLNIADGGRDDGSFTVESGATLGFTGGYLSLDANSSVSGAGNVNFSGALADIAGSYSLTGTTTISGGTVTFAQDVSLGSLTLSGGTLGGTSTVSISNTLTWTGGTMSGSGHTAANGGITLSGNNGRALDGRTLDNSGTATWTGTGNISTSNNAVWNNLSGSVFDAQGDATFGNGSATFNNAGTLQKSAGTGTTTINVFLNNTGTVDVASGTLSLPAGGSNSSSYTVETGATLTLGGGSHGLNAASTVSGAGNVTFSGANVTLAGGYSVTGTTTISNGTVSFDSNVTVTTLTLSGGTLTGGADVTVSGTLTWTGGQMIGAGRTIANGGMTISGNNGKTLSGRTLNNSGTATWTGGDINVFFDAVWNNLSGGTVDAQSNNRFGTDSVFHAEGTFNNAGTFKKSAGTGTTYGDIAFNNSGTVDAASGLLDLAGGGISSGTFTAESAATLQFGGGPHYLTSASSVSGSGTVIFDSETFNGLSMTINGTYNVTGTTTFQASNAPFAFPPVEFASSATMGTLNLGAGTLFGAGDVTITGTFNWTGGTLSGTGNTFANGGITISGSNNRTLDGRTITNSGTATWTGTGGISGNNDAVFNNLNGSVFDAQSDSTLGSSISFLNAGTFKKSAGTGTTTVNALFSNTGTLDVETGTVKLGGTFTNFDSTAAVLAGGTYLVKGTLQFNNAKITTNQATIILDGSAAKILNQSNANALATFANNLDGASFTIRNGANFTSAGDFNNLGALVIGPSSVFTVSGNYTQTSGGSLEVQLGGSPASGQFGKLAVTGTANLDGTLTVSLVNSYTPSSGDSFQIVTFASSSGSFATTILPSGASLTFNPTNVTVSF
jgi:hypothetical protein